MNQQRLNRREWLGATASALSLAACGATRQASGADAKRPRVAAVITEFTRRSHAHVILENFLEPYYFNGKLTESGIDVVRLKFRLRDAKLYSFQIVGEQHGR